MTEVLQQVKHVVVVMFENRSFDTFLGWLYPDGERPKVVLPAGSSPDFDGVTPQMSNPSRSGEQVFVTRSAANTQVPNPEPEATLENVNEQIFGSREAATPAQSPMQGFVRNYATTSAKDPTQVMQCHSASQLPVLFALARAYAVSDAWFASVPSQTWPNRSFTQAGTSNGHINNGTSTANPSNDAIPDPLEWDVRTIFNVLEDTGTPWAVYHDTTVLPSLTRTMFPKLWDASLSPRFKHFSQFIDDCASGSLPRYSFVEPSFLIDPTDQHPPHDVAAGDHFLYRLWKAVSTSPAWQDTLLLITFDEHGGNFDHVLPPGNAVPPDAASTPGDYGFGFDRFGVRVPAVLVSPRIAAGTVFRSPTDTPYDHTSILATLRDWLRIPAARMLPSARIAQAPTLAHVLTLDAPRTDLPEIAEPARTFTYPSLDASLNDLQRSLIAGNARRFGLDPHRVLAPLRTRAHAAEYLRHIKDLL